MRRTGSRELFKCISLELWGQLEGTIVEHRSTKWFAGIWLHACWFSTSYLNFPLWNTYIAIRQITSTYNAAIDACFITDSDALAEHLPGQPPPPWPLVPQWKNFLHSILPQSSTKKWYVNVSIVVIWFTENAQAPRKMVFASFRIIVIHQLIRYSIIVNPRYSIKWCIDMVMLVKIIQW